ncbi:MAG: aldose 1-epimerase [Ignavibacteria bacterium]|jgi:aldose 1-epimerase
MNNESVFTVDEVMNAEPAEVVIKNNSTGEFVSIIPGYGGRIKELWLNNGKKNISILKKVTRIDSEDRDDVFANAKLSPFAGRIRDAKYVFNDIRYNLFMNYPEEENACHGFIYDKQFSLTDKFNNKADAGCKLEYQYEAENQGYPFKYSIEISYILNSDCGLICTTKVVNKSGQPMPLVDGWHYYYDIGVKVDDLQMKLDVGEIIELDPRNIPTDKKKIFNDFDSLSQINERSFDSCFKTNGLNGKAVTELISEDHDIHLNIWQETGSHKYEYLVIYTPPDRKSIAIEPMTSNVNSFNNGEGLILLEPDKEYDFSCGIYLNKN